MSGTARAPRHGALYPGLAAVLAGWLFVLHSAFAATTEAPAPAAKAAQSGWGTFWKPFAADSLWNSRPVAPVFGEFTIPKSDYYSLVGEGKYSLGVFLARPSDGPVTVTGHPGGKGLWDPDAEEFRQSVTIPRWPPEATPAEGSDGHADIVDPVSGVVHSFFQLKRSDGRWTANQYAWTRIDGRGWGDPAHYFQGARAAGVPSMGGLIRRHEVGDGESMYRHALAMSLTFNGLAAKPAYIYPATSADGNAASTNKGEIPEGALLMLPASFDTQQITTASLRKVAETLKVYGAYVVDRNHGTPFYIYVENGSGFNLHAGKWNIAAATDLERIRLALRQVVSVGGWVDGNGRPYAPQRNLNLLSMRGPWRTQAGPAPGVFDTWSQAVVFPASSARVVQTNTTFRNLNAVHWAVPAAGKPYRLTAITTGGAQLRLQLKDRASQAILVDSKDLGNGESASFVWPEVPLALTVIASSGTGQPSSVRGELVGVER